MLVFWLFIGISMPLHTLGGGILDHGFLSEANPQVSTRALYGFSELYSALQQGHRVRVSVNYELCTPNFGPASDATEISTWEYFDLPEEYGIPHSIGWAATSLISDYQSSQGGYVYNHVSFGLYPNNTLRIFATDIYPNTYKPAYEETTYCNVTTDPLFPQAANFTVQIEPRVQLTTYEEILSTLDVASVVAFLDYNTCPVKVSPFVPSGSNTLQVSAGVTIKTIESFRGGRFAPQPYFGFTESVLIRNHGTGYAQNLDMFRVWQNNTVEVNVAMLDAITFKPVFTEYFSCNIDNPANGVKGLAFYRDE
jgi:hypothetical protein